MLADRDMQETPSYLFIMRVWSEQLGGGQQEWRGKVQLSPGGAVQYFRDLRSLGSVMESMLAQAAAAPAAGAVNAADPPPGMDG